jgi:hypothetical protein
MVFLDDNYPLDFSPVKQARLSVLAWEISWRDRGEGAEHF